MIEVLSARTGLDEQSVLDAALLLMFRRLAAADAKGGAHGAARFRKWHDGDAAAVAVVARMARSAEPVDENR